MENAARLHVLVVDDDPFMLELLQDMLQTSGVARVTTKSSARAGLQALSEHPDLLICDLSMPEIDGIEFLGAAAEARYRGSVLLLSGRHKAILQAAHGLAASHGLRVVGAFAKPMALSDLQAALRAAAQ